MLKITLISVGRLKEKYLRDASAEYIKRLGAFCKLNIIEIDEYRCPDKPSAAQISEVLADEGRRILSKIPQHAYTFAMCIEGKQMQSTELAQKLSELSINGTSHIVFIIGGSWGLSDEVKARANYRLSMSKMTFPHMLARIMLLEQIYRSMSILSGGEYHK